MRAGHVHMSFFIAILCSILSISQPGASTPIQSDEGSLPDAEFEIELRRRFELEQAIREDAAYELIHSNIPTRRHLDVEEQPAGACPVGTTLAWTSTDQVHARFGTVFAVNQYEPTKCYVDPNDAHGSVLGACPGNHDLYKPVALEITAKVDASLPQTSDVTWTRHSGKSCQSYADGDSTGRTLVESQTLCRSRPSCKAIVCPRGKASGCTLRGKDSLVVYGPEDCYTFKSGPVKPVVADCAINFTLSGGGYAFAAENYDPLYPVEMADGSYSHATLTGKLDLNGKLKVWWIAGDRATDQKLTGTMELLDGSTQEASLQGTALSHDQEPLGYRSPTRVRSTSTHIRFSLGQFKEQKITLEPKAFPKTTFFMATGGGGFYSGIQNNTHGSKLSYILIFSAWNSGAENSYPVDYGSGSTCSTFGGEGTGWKCYRQIQYKPGQRYKFHTIRTAASSSSVGKYGKGLWPSSFSSRHQQKGTDVSLWVTLEGSDTAPMFIATHRVPNTNLLQETYSYGFVENWATYDPSCLLSNPRAVEYKDVQSSLDGITWKKARTARFSNVFKRWNNEVCAAYAYGAYKSSTTDQPSFLWSIGGRECQSRPNGWQQLYPVVDLDSWTTKGQLAQFQGNNCEDMKTLAQLNVAAPTTEPTTTTKSQVVVKCPAGWTVGGTQCYLTNFGSRTYDDSVKFCKSIGANIASIHNKQENAAVLNIARHSYIGAESDGNGKWKWHDGTPWWQPLYHETDGIYGFHETRIIVSTDRKWQDWGKGESKFTVICSKAGDIITTTTTTGSTTVTTTTTTSTTATTTTATENTVTATTDAVINTKTNSTTTATTKDVRGVIVGMLALMITMLG